MPFRLRSALPLLCWALVSLPGAASAQGLRAEGNALEFRTDLPWARIQLLGEEEISGVSPLRVPGALDGDFWLRASGYRVETQFGRVRVRVDDRGTRIVSYGRGSLPNTLLQSLYPGLPQYMTEQKKKGVLMGVTGFFAASALAWAQSELWDADRAVTEAQREVDRAEDALDLQVARTELSVAREGKTYAADRRNLTMIAAGAVWGVSLLDAVVFRPSFRVTSADEGSLALEMKPIRRFDATVRSLVFPGLGQEYNGQPKKAFLVAGGGIAMGTWLIRTQDRYNSAVSAYETERIRYEGAIDIAERNARAAELEARYDDVTEKERSRNIAAGLTAAYWVVNVIDAALNFGSPWGENQPRPGGFGMQVDPLQGTLAARVSF
jgi:hypothetical protein